MQDIVKFVNSEILKERDRQLELHEELSNISNRILNLSRVLTDILNGNANNYTIEDENKLIHSYSTYYLSHRNEI